MDWGHFRLGDIVILRRWKAASSQLGRRDLVARCRWQRQMFSWDGDLAENAEWDGKGCSTRLPEW